MASTSKENYKPEEFLLNTLNDLDIGFVKVSNDGIILNHNLAFNKNFGFDPETNLIDTKVLDYWLNSEERNKFREILYKNGIVKKFVTSAKKIDGKKIFVELNTKLNKNSNGVVISSEGIFVDVTERIESEHKFRSLFDNMLEGFAFCKIITDENNIPVDFIYLEINDAFERLTGLKREETVGRRVTEVIPSIEDSEPNLFEIYGKVALTGENTKFEIFFEPLKIWLSISVYSPKKNYFVAVFDNITESKKAELKLRESEEKLKQLNKDLEQKIEERTQELRESEELFRNLFETMTEGIILTNVDGQIVQANHAAERILGLIRSSIEELNYISPEWEVLRPDGTSMPLNEMAGPRAMKEKQLVKNIVMGVKRPDKTIRWINVSAAPFLDEDNKISGIVGTFSDITDRKKAEQKLKESEEKYRLITEDSDDLIVVYNNKLKVEYLNEETHSRILGYESSKFRDNIFRGNLIHKEDLKDTAIAFQKGYREEIYTHIFRLRHKNGQYIWFEVKGKTFIGIKGLKKMLCISRDITELKEAEDVLIRLNKLKSEFLRRASHELKTPLISIKGYSDLILSLHADQLDPVIISKVKEIHDGCERLQNIINNLLKTSRLESPELKPKVQKEDISFLIKFCVHELESLAETRKQSIKLDIHNELYANVEKEEIHDVLSNLLSNAIKYTPPMGKIEIKTELQEGSVVISVKDNGIGFTEEQKTKILQQFGKIERYGQGLDLGIDGTGLGLYISKRIVESHGGKIWMESEGKNKGASFFFTLPTAK